MKRRATFILALFSVSISCASDKDILRDACGAIKAPASRSRCFDALERLSAPQTPPQSESGIPAVYKLSSRALECAPIEFSEIDVMPRDELEGLYCTYVAAIKISDASSKKALDGATEPSVRAALLRQQLSVSTQCTRGMSKSMDVIQRKYPGSRPDCSKLPVNLPAITGTTAVAR